MRESLRGSGRWRRIFGTLFLALWFFGQGVTASAEHDKPVVRVFAAVSLTEPLQELARRFQAGQNVEVLLNFAGSGLLAVQIEKGARADIFISAGVSFADKLVAQQLVLPTDQKVLLTNTLVVITQQENPEGLKELADLKNKVVDFLSMADPATVPAGQYAREALIAAGIWEALQGRIAPAVDVRAAVMQVAKGNARYGIVYKTDMVAADPIRIAYEIPGHLHSPIHYVVCLLQCSRRNSETVKFFQYLQSAEARDIFVSKGFQPL